MLQLLEIKQKFANLIFQMSKKRHLRTQNFLGELEWVTYERMMMYNLVNRLRKEMAKEPIGLSKVRRVEKLALGHTDYADKFSLYCAELVLKD